MKSNAITGHCTNFNVGAFYVQSYWFVIAHFERTRFFFSSRNCSSPSPYFSLPSSSRRNECIRFPYVSLSHWWILFYRAVSVQETIKNKPSFGKEAFLSPEPILDVANGLIDIINKVRPSAGRQAVRTHCPCTTQTSVSGHPAESSHWLLTTLQFWYGMIFDTCLGW